MTRMMPGAHPTQKFTIQTEEDTELVYVASSPYGEVNKEMRATLLNRR